MFVIIIVRNMTLFYALVTFPTDKIKFRNRNVSISSKLPDGVSSGADVLRHLVTSYPGRKPRGINVVLNHSIQHHSPRDGAEGAVHNWGGSSFQ